MSLTFDTKVFPSHFDDHAFPVYGFQQSRSEDPMHFNGAADDFLRKLLDCFRRESHVRCTEHETRRRLFPGFSRSRGPRFAIFARSRAQRLDETAHGLHRRLGDQEVFGFDNELLAS
jgi:hypothetical protein